MDTLNQPLRSIDIDLDEFEQHCLFEAPLYVTETDGVSDFCAALTVVVEVERERFGLTADGQSGMPVTVDHKVADLMGKDWSALVAQLPPTASRAILYESERDW